MSDSTPLRSERHPGVSIIVPVYNEREALADTLRDIPRVMAENTERWDWEIIVVDDGSTDGSGEIIREALNATPGLRPAALPPGEDPTASGEDPAVLPGALSRLIQHPANRGYGAALKTGFAAARYDWVAFLDADGSYPPAELPRLIERMPRADMVVGHRVQYGRYASWARGAGKRILHPLAEYLAGCRIPDLNSGMRVVRRDLAERYWSLLPDGFSFTTTLTMALLSAGRMVDFVPINFSDRKGRSKIRPLRDMRNFAILLVRTVTYFHPLKVYLPLSALLVTASIAVVAVSKMLTGRVMDVTALFLFIAGLQLLLVGVLADLVLKLLGTRR